MSDIIDPTGKPREELEKIIANAPLDTVLGSIASAYGVEQILCDFLKHPRGGSRHVLWYLRWKSGALKESILCAESLDMLFQNVDAICQLSNKTFKKILKNHPEHVDRILQSIKERKESLLLKASCVLLVALERGIGPVDISPLLKYMCHGLHAQVYARRVLGTCPASRQIFVENVGKNAFRNLGDDIIKFLLN